MKSRQVPYFHWLIINQSDDGACYIDLVERFPNWWLSVILSVVWKQLSQTVLELALIGKDYRQIADFNDNNGNK